MSVTSPTVETELTRRFFIEHTADAARLLEEDELVDGAEAVASVEPGVAAPVLERMMPHHAASLIAGMSADAVPPILEKMLPNRALSVIGAMDETTREDWLGRLEPGIEKEFRELMTFDQNSAGRIMDMRAPTLREDMNVDDAISQLRHTPSRTASSVFLADKDGVLSGRVTMQDLATADHAVTLVSLKRPLITAIDTFTSQDEIVETLEKYKIYDLPVTDIDGRLVGIVYHDALLAALHEVSSTDMQTMVGVSKDERALSPALFAVRKRLPWLQINLLTAFLAASVVGLFEATIAAYTALAVLLPVVAGQSGNSGSQALAVTIRGLALREITPRQLGRVMTKEVITGLINGIAIAITCGIGVYFWSGSVGLVIVIMVSMVMAMVAAGFAGAVVPITLRRLGQDPAQSSSIILTTVTDVAGFFSFLGIATLMLGML